MEERTKWWKFVLSILTFVILYFLAPLILSLLWHITNLFSPKAYQNTAEWINIVTTAFGHIVAIVFADAILEKKHPVFSMVISIVSAFYSLGVSIWNFAIGTTDIFQMLAMWASAVASIVLAVSFAKEIGKKEQKDQQEVMERIMSKKE